MSGKVFLVMNDEDYYRRPVEAIYTTREAAEEHIAAIAAKGAPFPSSELFSVEDVAERSIDEEEVLDRFDGLPHDKEPPPSQPPGEGWDGGGATRA